MFDIEGIGLARVLVMLFLKPRSMIVVVAGTWAVRHIAHCQMVLVH